MVELDELIAAIRASRGILLTTHRNPDGDGIGSQLALYHALSSGGFPVSMHNRDTVPRIYEFLQDSELVSSGLDYSAEGIDLIISLDAGARSRLGFDDRFFDGRKLAVIDHHASNTSFGDINVIDTSACSTGAIVYSLIQQMDLSLSPGAASALFVTLLTDTASFRSASATAEVHELAAELIRAGAESWPIARSVYEDRRLECYQLQVRCMQTLVLRNQGRSAWLYVDEEMYRDTGADGEDTEGLIDQARALSGVEVAVFIRPGDDASSWKVTFRGKYDADVSALAGSLGGGGHRHAAGCIMRGDFESIRNTVEKAVEVTLG